MAASAEHEGSSDLPEFERPPVVEVAMGVQFRPIPQLRPIELAALRDAWRPEYPVVQEQPPLPPATESAAPGSPSVRVMLGPALESRLWFASADQRRLIQLQPDRLIVNWRQRSQEDRYPRYPAVRAEFKHRLSDVASDLERRRLAPPAIVQAELTYINAIDVPMEAAGELDRFVKVYRPDADHHLGSPEQARINLVFRVPGVGQEPVRLHVAVNPARRPGGSSAIFLTLTLRGAPLGEASADALAFMDQAHSHLVRSFAELTSEAMHTQWGVRT